MKTISTVSENLDTKKIFHDEILLRKRERKRVEKNSQILLTTGLEAVKMTAWY